MRKLIGLVACLGVASFAQANDNYVVNAKVYENKELISSPTLIVDANKEASISVENSYAFTLTVAPADKSSVNLATELKIGGQQISPSLIVELGKELGNQVLSVMQGKDNDNLSPSSINLIARYLDCK